MLHELFKSAVRVVDKELKCVYDLAQIVGRDICSHTYGDTYRAVYQQIWET